MVKKSDLDRLADKDESSDNGKHFDGGYTWLPKTVKLFMGFKGSLPVLVAMVVSLAPTIYGQKRSDARSLSRSSTRTSLTIQTEPNATVWLDDIRRGVTDTTGKLVLTTVAPGRHSLRVRAGGFKEASIPLIPGRGSALAVRLLRTTDEAELAFQQAEDAREKSKDDESRKQSAEFYRRALKLRPGFSAAHVGLARVLMDLNQSENALAEIEAARGTRALYAEASAVEGRIYREMAFADQAIKSFQR